MTGDGPPRGLGSVPGGSPVRGCSDYFQFETTIEGSTFRVLQHTAHLAARAAPPAAA
ncbi:hypothetical protein ACWDFR_21930 [Streptomyces sp. 900105755]